MRHNELRDEIGDIACMAFAPSAVSTEPHLSNTQTATIPTGQPIHDHLNHLDASASLSPPDPPPLVPSPTPPDPSPADDAPANPDSSLAPNQCGDLAIRGLYEWGYTAIIEGYL